MNIEKSWEDILNKVKIDYNISQISFLTWLQPLTVHSVEGNIVTVIVPDTSINQKLGLEYVDKKFKHYLQETIREVTGISSYEVTFILPDGETIEADKNTDHTQEEIVWRAEKAELDPQCTFDNFIVNDNNRFAYAAAQAVAEAPEIIYNPLFLYGADNSERTHLMNAIANHIIVRDPGRKVVYSTVDSFVDELIQAVRSGRSNAMSEFRDKFRNCDVLLIDNIQNLAGKYASSEEFLFTFVALLQAKKQIIIGADKPPKDMILLEEELRSRLEWGLIAGITPPDENNEH